MKQIILKVTNGVAYIGTCYGIGSLLGWIVNKLFGDFLTDEAYAEQHPYRYLLAVFGILVCELIIGLAIIYGPLMMLYKFIDSKIDGLDSKDEEWD